MVRGALFKHFILKAQNSPPPMTPKSSFLLALRMFKKQNSGHLKKSGGIDNGGKGGKITLTNCCEMMMGSKETDDVLCSTSDVG